MRSTVRIATSLTALLAMASPAAAQQVAERCDAGDRHRFRPEGHAGRRLDSEADAAAAAAESSWKKGRPITMQYFRAQDRRGINVFETTKDPGVEFTGFKLDFGAAFTSQVQNLSHTQHGDAEHRERRQRQSARGHRVRLQ